MKYKNLFIRNISSGDFFEAFFVSAVTSILVIRFFLFLTDYPQLGGANFHIAHMLWGGFLMMIALILVFGFLNRSVYLSASIIGGIGFGAFIDELGKFITKDNNYFFQPTIALIYIIFVVLYFVLRRLSHGTKYTSTEYLINSLQLLEDAIVNNLDKDEKKQALAYLKKSNRQNPVVESIEHLFKTLETVHENEKHNLITKSTDFLKNLYLKIAKTKWFSRTIIVIFLFQALGVALQLLVINTVDGEIRFDITDTNSFIEFGKIVSSFLAGIFVLIGIITIYRSRLSSYRYFKLSLLINIFFTQVFTFYQSQFYALVGLSINLILLISIDYLITQEKALQLED